MLAAPALARAAVAVAGVSAFFLLLNHVPIVIAGSPLFPFIGGVQRVLCAAVIVVLVMTARATRLAAEHVLEPVQLSPSLRGAA
jgi:hypothetical protein